MLEVPAMMMQINLVRLSVATTDAEREAAIAAVKDWSEEFDKGARLVSAILWICPATVLAFVLVLAWRLAR